MFGSTGVLLLALVGCVLAIERDGRWLNREVHTITKVEEKQIIVTEVTPSSCVVVQTSLPPCRHLRAVNIQPSQPQRIMQTAVPMAAPQAASNGWKPMLQPSDPVNLYSSQNAQVTPPPPAVKTTPSSWWNFFNRAPIEVYVTSTSTVMYTTKYMDPKTVVTFSVKGCRPSRLPFDLPECQPPRIMTPEPEMTPEKGIIVMAPIQFVPSIPNVSASGTVKDDNRVDVKVVEEEKDQKDKKEKEVEKKVEEKKEN